jgi:chromosome segregation ATPase
MGAARKLKALEPEPLPLPATRQPLADAIAAVAAVREQIAEAEAEIESARERIREAEAAVETAKESLGAAPALQRRAARENLREAEESLQDWRDHLAELKAKAGDDGKVHDYLVGLPAALANAEMKVRGERAALLRSHPRVWAMLSAHESLRAELAQVFANLQEIERVNAIPESSKHWQFQAADYRPPKADAALTAWLEKLTSDPAAEIEEAQS